MAKKQSLKAALRARTGSGKLNQMRREGWLPSVIYGRGTENQNLKVDAKAFSEMLAGSSSENIVVNLDIEDMGTRMAFLQAVHHAPLSGKPLHVDFLSIDENTEITANIPVHLVGEAAGVKAGGLIELYLHMVEVVCLPNDLPEAVEFDVTHLNEGDSLHISEVTFPAGVRPTHAPEVTIAHVGKQGSGEEAAAEAEAAGGAGGAEATAETPAA
ncbi:MAG: 50S ribosomal protein L25 [Akkermansiaceae bacterium]|nr:50S ribosomal protein L25 [Akkermansiaceae bacterium]MCF7733740.1 50S ribosomal protein L25 [Akkermansiaceae bacterium]